MTDAGPVAEPRSRRMFLVTLSLWALWVGLLAAITWTFANPVTFSLPQLLQSSAVVTAELVDSEKREVRVLAVHVTRKSFTDDALAGSTQILPNLPVEPLTAGERYIIPVSRTGIGYRVTEPRLPALKGVPKPRTGPPAVYPASETALEELRRYAEELDLRIVPNRRESAL